MRSQAFIPAFISQNQSKVVSQIASVIVGAGMLSLLAQLKITLPWTPVPITGQTFGVALLALMWGSRLSMATFLTYLSIGFLGAPVFAGGLSGFTIGPTFGYLVGMLFASIVVGKLSDMGWGRTFKKAISACYIGSFIIFSCGAIGLSFFVPKDQVFMLGVFPFLIGDLIKNTLAAASVSSLPLKD